MASTLQQNLKKLEIPDSNATVKKYLAKYMTKDNNKEDTFCSFIDRSVEIYPSNCVEELEEGSSKCGGEFKKTEDVTETFDINILPKSAEEDVTETFNFNILPKSAKGEIVYGMRYFSKMLKETYEFSESLISLIKNDMKLLVESDDVPPQPLPTGRSYRYTDAVYLKIYEIEIAFEKYIEFTSAKNLNCDSTFDLVQKDSILTIVSLYMYKIFELLKSLPLHSVSDLEEINGKLSRGLLMQKEILKHYNFDFSKVRVTICNMIFYCYHNQGDNMENQPYIEVDIMDCYLENANEFMNKTDPDTLEIILRETFANSQISFEDIKSMINCIKEHPIYQPVAVAFYYSFKCGCDALYRGEI